MDNTTMDPLLRLLDITVDSPPDNQEERYNNSGSPGAGYEAENDTGMFTCDSEIPLGQVDRHSPEVTSRTGSTDSVFTFTEDGLRTVEEYRGIVKLYRELPKDMCIARLVQDYGSCEQDLENVRDLYFEHLKNTCEDFPFDDNASLKRRMFTRTGEPVSVRLAQDIYSIVEVTEGGDPSVLRTMISTGQRGKRVSVACGRKRQTGQRYSSATGKSSANCSCSSELKLLKDTVSTLQADVLLLKQTIHVAENLQKQQNEQLSRGLMDIKKYILNCSSSLAEYTGNTLSCIRNVSHSVMEQVISVEDRVRLLEAKVESQTLCTDTSPPSNSDDIHENSLYLASELPVVEEERRRVETPDIPAAEPGPGTEHFPAAEQQAYVDNSGQLPTGAAIPVRVTSRGDTERVHQYREDDGFIVHTRKKTKRFCVLGLSCDVNVQILSEVIRIKGPTVTNIRVFPCRRDSSKVVLRLNVAADSYSDRVLNTDFWPRYVTCRPWNEHNGKHRRIDRRELPPRFRVTSQQYLPPRFHRTFNQGEFVDRNRYDSLIGDVD